MARELTNWIDTYLEYTERTEPRRIFHEWVAVAVVAACLQRKCSIRPWGDFTEYFPNLYVVLVGPPGARKGTAMKVGRYFLEKLQINLAAESTTREACIDRLERTQEMYQVKGRDGKEKYDVHCSLTIYQEELTTFLGYNNLPLITDLQTWFDCVPYRYETIGRGEKIIHGVWVNMLGATTPQLIQTSMPRETIGGGLASRIIFVFESNKKRKIGATHMPAEMLPQLENDLQRILAMKGQFAMTEEFADRYIPWYELESDETPLARDLKFLHYIERRARHMWALCMVLSASRSDEMILRIEDFTRALDLLERTEAKMSRTFAGFGVTRGAQALPKMMDYIADRRRVTKEDLLTVFWGEFDSPKHLDAAISYMKKLKFIHEVADEKHVYYDFNPAAKSASQYR